MGHRENLQALHLIEAMVGFVSPNVRMVCLESSRRESACIRVLLDKESEDDREAWEDVVFEFEALQLRPVDVELHVTVNAGPEAVRSIVGRPLFRRRE